MMSCSFELQKETRRQEKIEVNSPQLRRHRSLLYRATDIDLVCSSSFRKHALRRRRSSTSLSHFDVPVRSSSSVRSRSDVRGSCVDLVLDVDVPVVALPLAVLVREVLSVSSRSEMVGIISSLVVVRDSSPDRARVREGEGDQLRRRVEREDEAKAHFVLNLSVGPPALSGSCLSFLRSRANSDLIFLERASFNSPTASFAQMLSSSEPASSSRRDLSFFKT